MCILPDDLKSFFLTTNGLLIQWSIKFDGDNESAAKPFLNLSNFQSETFLYIELQKMVGQ